MAYIPDSGSVVAFQSDPNNLQASVTGTVTVRNPQSSVLVGNFPTNQSVSGTVGASVLGHAPVVIVGGSIATSSTPNQSVSGTVQTDVRGSVATVIIGGSIATSFTPPANQSVSGTVGASIIGQALASGTYGNIVIATQPHDAGAFGDDYANNPQNYVDENYNQILQAIYPFVFNGSTWDRQRGNSSIGTLVSTGRSSVITLIQGSVAVSVTPVANQSVSGTVGASVIGHAPVVIVGGSVAVGGVANQSVSGTVGASVIGTVPVTQSGTNITSLVSTVPSSVIVGASIFGQAPVFNIGGISSVSQGGAWTVSVVGTVGNTQSGTWRTSLVNIVPSSVLVGASIFGTVPTFEAQMGGSSVYAVLSSLSTISVMVANANRKAATIYNNSGTTVFIKLGTAATTSVFTVAMVDQSYYELPTNYTSVVAGIANSNAGRINVTEITF